MTSALVVYFGSAVLWQCSFAGHPVVLKSHEMEATSQNDQLLLTGMLSNNTTIQIRPSMVENDQSDSKARGSNPA